MVENRPGLRERTRRAVRREIAEAANRLFLERGFEATTIDDIAALAGMSQRSVFRYFASKEEIILGKLDFVAEEMLASLSARPTDEPVWQTLRGAFDVLGTHADLFQNAEAAEEMQRVVIGTPSLFASYLLRLQQLQDEVVAVLAKRAQSAGMPYANGDPTPRALTAAAFGCLIAAQQTWLAHGAKGKFSDVLDRSMAAIAPTGAMAG